MQIAAIVSQKGGVGKTTLAIHLTTEATRAGKKALLVDLDPQGNASRWAGLVGATCRLTCRRRARPRSIVC